MGLILKLKKSQKEGWSVFLNHAISLLHQNKLLGLPFGKSGYGFIADPFNDIMMGFLEQQFQEKFPTDMIFLTHKPDFVRTLGKIPETLISVIDRIWPNDLIIKITPNSKINLISNKVYRINPNFWELFRSHKIKIMNPKHPVIEKFLELLEEKGFPPILIGFYAQFSPEYNCQNAEDLLDFFSDNILGAILDGGRLQGEHKPKSATIIQVDDGKIKVIKEGLIKTHKILDQEPKEFDFSL